MPDSKITALASIGTGTDPAVDPLVIVDVSDTSMAATGTTKKVTLNNLLASGPAATLASATITGDLTVDTSTLKVDSANNRVGIGTASPNNPLTVNGTIAAWNKNAYILYSDSGSTYIGGLGNGGSIFGSGTDNDIGITTGGATNLRLGTNNTERMRLDSSGNVGIGVTPSAWVAGAKALQFGAYGALAQSSSGNIELSFNSYNSGAGAYKYLQTDTASLYRASSVHSWFVAPSGTAGNAITFTQAMTLDASGNLILLSSNTPATLTTNGQLTVNATSNTNLRFSYRGSDGVTRVANITLA